MVSLCDTPSVHVIHKRITCTLGAPPLVAPGGFSYANPHLSLRARCSFCTPCPVVGMGRSPLEDTVLQKRIIDIKNSPQYIGQRRSGIGDRCSYGKLRELRGAPTLKRGIRTNSISGCENVACVHAYMVECMHPFILAYTYTCICRR